MEFIEALDQGSWNWFQDHHQQSWLNAVMVGLGWLCHPAVLAGIVFLTVVYLGCRNRVRDGAIFGISLLLGMAVLQLSFLAFVRPRPVFLNPLETRRSTPCFPCDQSLLASVTFVGLGLLIANGLVVPKHRRMVLIVTAVLVFLIGTSRLYVGQSYFSDVVAGWMIGTALALACRAPAKA